MTIDREKAKSLHVPLSQITDTLGIFMGSSYVNDFDFNNRSYRVYVQADKQFRATRRTSSNSMFALTAAPWCRSITWSALRRPPRRR